MHSDSSAERPRLRGRLACRRQFHSAGTGTVLNPQPRTAALRVQKSKIHYPKSADALL